MNIEIPTEDGELVCVICYDKIGSRNSEGVREQPVQLDCQHVFGNVCLDSWLAKKSRCPICRSPVEGYASASSSDGSEHSDSSDERSDNELDEDSDDVTETSDDADDIEEVDEGEGESDVDDSDEASQVSEATHITISSDGSEGSAMSLDAEAEHTEDEDTTDDSEGAEDAVPNHSSQDQPATMTPQDILQRLTPNSITSSLMSDIARGRINFSTFLSRSGVPQRQYVTVEDSDDDSDQGY